MRMRTLKKITSRWNMFFCVALLLGLTLMATVNTEQAQASSSSITQDNIAATAQSVLSDTKGLIAGLTQNSLMFSNYYLGGIDIYNYCKYLSNSAGGFWWNADANGYYSWRCSYWRWEWGRGPVFYMNVFASYDYTRACRWQYNKQNAYASNPNTKNIYGWKCYV